MTTPIEVDHSELWGHALRSQNRAVDYRTGGGNGPDGPWPSQQAYDDAHQSMAGAGKAFGDRQEDRGKAVGAAADGFSGQDQDSSKMLQAVGSLIGPAFGAIASVVQGLFTGAATSLGAGATSLSGLLTSGGTLLSQGLPKGPQTDVLAKAGAAGGAPASLGAGLPLGAGPLSPPNTGHGPTSKDGRPEGHDGELKIEPAVGVMPGGMGLGGMPRTPEKRSEKEEKPPTFVVAADDKPAPVPAMVPVQASIKGV